MFREVPQPLEEMRLNLTLSRWKNDFFFFGPQGLVREHYISSWPDGIHLEFQDKDFLSVRAYSDFMLRPDLYDSLRDYSFALICQTDALLTRNIDSEEVSSFEFDYLGARWIPGHKVSWNPVTNRFGRGVLRATRRILTVGNGGLSLRRISSFRLAARLIPKNIGENEDILFSYFGRYFGLKIGSPVQADKYFWEGKAKDWEEGQPIPDVCGFHALEKFNPQLEAKLLKLSK